jgi:hypothetical protein
MSTSVMYRVLTPHFKLGATNSLFRNGNSDLATTSLAASRLIARPGRLTGRDTRQTVDLQSGGVVVSREPVVISPAFDVLLAHL